MNAFMSFWRFLDVLFSGLGRSATMADMGLEVAEANVTVWYGKEMASIAKDAESAAADIEAAKANIAKIRATVEVRDDQ